MSMMIRGKFLNTRQRTDLEDVLRHQREEHGVARRANAILLLDDGKSCQAIAEFLCLDDDTIRTWHKHYISGGFDGLFTFDWQGGKSRMSVSEEADLCDYFSRSMPRNSAQEVTRIVVKGYFFEYGFSVPCIIRIKTNNNTVCATRRKARNNRCRISPPAIKLKIVQIYLRDPVTNRTSYNSSSWARIRSIKSA